ncbi:hypothetical protein MAHJHV29_50000 [Mycobacterium avium subsp. hominissuis]
MQDRGDRRHPRRTHHRGERPQRIAGDALRPLTAVVRSARMAADLIDELRCGRTPARVTGPDPVHR